MKRNSVGDELGRARALRRRFVLFLFVMRGMDDGVIAARDGAPPP